MAQGPEKTPSCLPKTDFPMRANLVQARAGPGGALGQARPPRRHPTPGAADAPRFRPARRPAPLPTATSTSAPRSTRPSRTSSTRYKSMRGLPHAVRGPAGTATGPADRARRFLARDPGKEAHAPPPPSCAPSATSFSEGWIAQADRPIQAHRRARRLEKNEYKDQGSGVRGGHRAHLLPHSWKRALFTAARNPSIGPSHFENRARPRRKIEYKDHTSIAIWVKFLVPVEEAKKFGLPTDKPLYIVIWTTHPSGRSPLISRSRCTRRSNTFVADVGTERLLVAQALLGFGCGSRQDRAPAPPSCSPLPGAKLEHLQARHPFIDRASPVVLADYVTTDSGNRPAVHTRAGPRPPRTTRRALKYKLEIYCSRRRRTAVTSTTAGSRPISWGLTTLEDRRGPRGQAPPPRPTSAY